MDEREPPRQQEQADPDRVPATQRPRPRWSRRRKVLVWSAAAMAFVLFAAGVSGWLLFRHLNHNIRTTDAGTTSTTVDGTQDILIVGSDNRSGADAKYGTADGARSDTTILFHTPADRRDATAVSIPRDSMVQIPDCTKSDGTIAPANYGMFNSAFDEGGIACTVKTVESLTGVTITHFVVLDFTGFAATVDALGGVKVCTTTPIDDPDSDLDIPAGVQTLNGEQSLAFVRVRHIGDGSDLARIERQQYFMHVFSAQIRASGLLTDPLKLYRVLNSATKSIVTDPGLGSLTDLYSLAQTLNQIPDSDVSYQTVPVVPYPEDNNRVIWDEPSATDMWAALLTEPATAPTGDASADATATDAALGESDTQSTAIGGMRPAGEVIPPIDVGANPEGVFTCPVA